MKLGGILVGLVAAALLMWWGFGKPGLWLRDRLCWIDNLSPGDGAVVQWREMDQPVRVSGRTSWLALNVAVAATQAGELTEVTASDLKWVSAAGTLGSFEAELPLRRGWNYLLVRCRWLDPVSYTHLTLPTKA